MRILVCGGRDFGDRDLLEEVLSPYRPRDDARETVVIHGGARGADDLADDWALEYGAAREVFPARWEEYGRSAGPIRNRQMLDGGRPDLVIAFPGGWGTADMVQQAHHAGVEVMEVGDDVRVEAVCEALCASRKFETGQGGCAPICMEMLGCSRPRCIHKTRVHADLARAVIRACDGVQEQ